MTEHGSKLLFLLELEGLAFAERPSLLPLPSWLRLRVALISSARSSLLTFRIFLTLSSTLLSLLGVSAMMSHLRPTMFHTDRGHGMFLGLCPHMMPLLEGSPNLSTRARLLAVATRESGVWLNVLLVSSLGLCMDNDVIRVAVGLRLGAPLCEPHHCLHCRAEVDS